MIIAIAGKGSVGKTTLSELLLDPDVAPWIPRPLLLVDADPQGSLQHAIGMNHCPTVGHLRSAFERDMAAGRVARPDQSIEESLEAQMACNAVVAIPNHAQTDFLALGRWELPGSQCTTNRVLSRGLHRLAQRYHTVVIDNEAGLEHLGRYVDVPIDLYLVITGAGDKHTHAAEAILSEARRRSPQVPVVIVGNAIPASTVNEWKAWAETCAKRFQALVHPSPLPLAAEAAHGVSWKEWKRRAVALWHGVMALHPHASPSLIAQLQPDEQVIIRTLMETMLARR